VSDVVCSVGIWLANYLVISTLLLSCSALIERYGVVRSVEGRELLWRVALVGGLVTAALHSSAGLHRIFPLQSWTLGQAISPVSQGNHNLNAVDTSSVNRNKIQNSTIVVDGLAKKGDGETKDSSSKSDLTYAYAERFALRSVVLLAFVWFIGAIVNTTRLLVLGAAARARLRNRSPVAPLFAMEIQSLQASKLFGSPILSVDAGIDGPISLPNGEIVVPPWIFELLSLQHRQAIYAHELAHHVRRDPIWLLCLHLLNAIVWLQPLNHLARRRLVHLAELQADAWAARTLPNPRILAESLLACAERLQATPTISFVSQFSSKGALVERIDHLLAGAADKKPFKASLAQFVAVCSLMMVMILMPGCDVDSRMAYRTGERISVTQQGNGKKGEATIRRANLYVRLNHEGHLKLSPNNDDVEMLDKGGRFVLSESIGRIKRLYTITSDEFGELKREFLLNGKPTPIDENVSAWFAEALKRTVRESGFQTVQ
jgi:beta-lactamase regulating signal transducer with metallopeptidase domain